MRRETRRRAGRLRALVRAGDPFANEPPSADAMRRMRARVLAAANRDTAGEGLAGRLAPGLRWRRAAVAGSCVALLAVAAYVGSLMLQPPAPPALRVVMGSPAPAPIGPNVTVQPTPPSANEASPTGTRRRHARVHAPAGTRPVPVPVASPDLPRQIQFTTPGGTRIVWTVDPHFTPPKTMIQEQEDLRCAGY